MTVQKRTYECSAGLTRTLDINVDNLDNDIGIVENFVAYESEYPEFAFLPECHDCKIGSLSMRIGDDLVMHMVKVCTITKVEGK